MIPTLGAIWVALILTVISVALHRASRNPKTAGGDAVLVDLCLGLTAVAASTFWFSVLLQILF